MGVRVGRVRNGGVGVGKVGDGMLGSGALGLRSGVWGRRGWGRGGWGRGDWGRKGLGKSGSQGKVVVLASNSPRIKSSLRQIVMYPWANGTCLGLMSMWGLGQMSVWENRHFGTDEHWGKWALGENMGTWVK